MNEIYGIQLNFLSHFKLNHESPVRASCLALTKRRVQQLTSLGVSIVYDRSAASRSLLQLTFSHHHDLDPAILMSMGHVSADGESSLLSH